MAKPIPYDDDPAPESDERDMRKIVLYDEEALKLMQGWTGGQDDPLYAISSTGGWNYAWVFEDAIANISMDLNKVKKIGRNKYQLGKGEFTKAEIDELHTIRQALSDALYEVTGEIQEAQRPPAKPLLLGWTVESGRMLFFNGRPFVSLNREGGTLPVEADGAVHVIAELLNQAGVTPESIHRQHMGYSSRIPHGSRQ